jgi:trimethylamine--corrinoid protein Co-methyltransferase
MANLQQVYDEASWGVQNVVGGGSQVLSDQASWVFGDAGVNPQVMHDEACWLLENVGVRLNHPYLIKVLENTGYAGFDGSSGRIHILRPLVDRAIATAPKRSEHPVPSKSFCGGGTAPHVRNNGNLVEADLHEHVAAIAEIAEREGIPSIFRGAGGAHNAYEDVEQIRVMREHFSRYIMLYVATEEGVKACAQEYKRNPNMCTTHSLFYSPLQLNDTGPRTVRYRVNGYRSTSQLIGNVNVFLRCVEEGLPIYLLTMPISYVTSPATLYGTAVQVHAEFLIGLCLVQTLNPGLMTIDAAFPQAGDPRDEYNISFGSISHNLVNLMAAKVATYLNLPAIQDGCSAGGKELLDPTIPGDVLRAYRMWNWAYESGWCKWHMVRHCYGFLNYQLVYDIHKMEGDAATLKRVLQNNEQFPIPSEMDVYDPDAIYVIEDVIKNHGGNFRTHPHTLKHSVPVL